MMKRRIKKHSPILRYLKIGGVFVVTLAVIIASVLVFGREAVKRPLPQPPQVPAPTEQQETIKAGIPRQLTIDAIHVTAPIIPMGVTDNGMLASPEQVSDVGWYDQSDKPGSGKGAVLLDGHVTGTGGIEGVFYHLKSLQAGDMIKVKNEHAQVVSYVVKEQKTIPAKEVDMREMMYSVDEDKEGLNLITCGGDFDHETQQYPDRVLVFAVRHDM